MGDHATGALGREEQVDTQTASLRGDGVETGLDLGLSFDQQCELVDDDQQVGEWFAIDRRQPRVVDDVGHSRCVEQSLAATDLGVERGERPHGEGSVALEVGHQADHVGKLRERSEGRPAFEVDQEQRELRRRVGDRQRDQERLEQLTLA